MTPGQTAAKPDTSQTANRKLVVGRGIVFSGEITSCDCLVVEGTVKANIAGCHDINIAEGGLFTGSATVENAEIRGKLRGRAQCQRAPLDPLPPGGSRLKSATIRSKSSAADEVSGQIQVQEGAQPAGQGQVAAMPRRA